MTIYKCVLDHSKEVVSGCPICYWKDMYRMSIDEKIAQSDKFVASLDKIHKDVNDAITEKDRQIHVMSEALKMYAMKVRWGDSSLRDKEDVYILNNGYEKAQAALKECGIE